MGEFLDKSFWRSQGGTETFEDVAEEAEVEDAAPETLLFEVGKLKLFSASIAISSTLTYPLDTEEERRLVI